MSEDWTFFTNHGYVLMALGRQADLRLRDIAERVGITERAAQSIVNDLVAAGYLERSREGRRNRYRVRGETALRHLLTKSHRASDLLRLMVSETAVNHDEGPCHAVVVACGDYRYQRPLQELLSSEGLAEHAELVLWPGGGARLAAPDADQLLSELATIVAARQPSRVLLVAHQGCTAPGVFAAKSDDPAATSRALLRLRRKAAAQATVRLGVTPELWFMGERWGRRVALRTDADSHGTHGGSAHTVSA